MLGGYYIRLLFHLFLTFITGGLWLIVLVVRALLKYLKK